MSDLGTHSHLSCDWEARAERAGADAAEARRERDEERGLWRVQKRQFEAALERVTAALREAEAACGALESEFVNAVSLDDHLAGKRGPEPSKDVWDFDAMSAWLVRARAALVALPPGAKESEGSGT